MAIPILNHLDFQQSAEIQNVILHTESSGSVSGNVAGQIIYDSGTIKYNNGSGWVSVGTASGTMSNWIGSDDGGDDVTISDGEYVKFVGSGITTNWTDTDGGGSSDEHDLTFTIDAAQTGITTIYNTSLVVGSASAAPTDGSRRFVDFTNSARTIIGYTSDSSDTETIYELRLGAGFFSPGTDNLIDLGASLKKFKDLYIDGVAYLDAINLNGTAISATAAEINILDGVTATATELNILDGVTATATELNILDGVTSSTAELNVLDGYTGSVTELNYLDTLHATGVTSTEFDYLDGVTSNIQTQLDAKGTSNLALGTSGSTALAGNTTVDDVSVANLKTRLAGGFASNAVQIGDSNDTVTIGNDLIITGDLTVSGDTITANVGTLEVEDKNITINKGSGDTSSTADGAGITIQDAVDASNDASLTWNASNDKFVFSHLIDAPGTSIFVNLDVSGDVDVDGTLETDALSINGTAVSATAAELNIMDGVTATTSELNIMDGVTASTNELNILDGVTATATELNLLDGITTLSGSNTGDESASSKVAAGIVQLATNAEVQTGTNALKAVTPDTLAAKSVVATIAAGSIDSTQLSAVIQHDLGTKNLIVSAQMVDEDASGDYGNCVIDWECTSNGSTDSDDHIYIKFASTPASNVVVNISSIKGATSVSPTYPS